MTRMAGSDRPDAVIFDPFAGASGDMVVAALVDMGLGTGWLRDRVASLDLGATVEVERVDRNGLECARVRFVVPDDPVERRLADILEVVDRAGLTPRTRAVTSAVFRRLAGVEAALHGVEVDQVHFHEVGAADSILDVVCAVAGMEELGYRRCYTRPVAVGGGTATMSHGTYPLPAPATVRLLEGLPVRETGYEEECTTPTGAALIAELSEGRRVPDQVVYGRSGYGAGSRDPRGRPNCLRLIECRVVERGDDATRLFVVAADLDDQAPEYVAAAREALMVAGAVDVTLARIEMKKGRPGVRLEALVPEPWLEPVLEALFRGTTTIGVRYWPVERRTLARETEIVEWRGRPIRVKRVRLPDGQERRKPELDDVMAAARETGLTPYEVRLELDAAEARSDPAHERGSNE